MNADILMVFDRHLSSLPVYEVARAKILGAFPKTRVKVGKTQISFYNRHLFAALSPPLRKIKGAPDGSVLLTFGLGFRLADPRVYRSVEPYPGRWTHHVIISSLEEMDDQVMGWLAEAYDFSLNK